MKKTLIGIGLLTLLLVALVGTLLFLQNEEEAPLPEALQETPRLFAFSAPVRSIVIEQAGKEAFTLENRSSDPETVDGMLSGREHLPVDTAKVGAVLQAAGNLPYLEVVLEEPDDLAPFGLAPAVAQVTIIAADGQSETLRIGETAPDATGRYLMREGDSALYLVPVYTLDNYLLAEYDYLSHTITPAGGYPLSFERVTLSGGKKDAEIVIVPGERPGLYRLESPVDHPLDAAEGFGAVSALFGLQSGNIARIDLQAEDLEPLGLDDPWATITVESESVGSFTLLVGEPHQDGDVFLLREGVPVLYTAQMADLACLTMDWFEMMSKTAYAPSLSEVASLTVRAGENLSLLDAVVSGEEDARTVTATWRHPEQGEGEGALEFENYERFYETVVGATILAPAEEEPSSGPVLTAAFTLSAGGVHTVSYYESDTPRRLLIRVDDGRYYYVAQEYVDTLQSGLDLLCGGGIVPTYLG